MCLNNLRKKKKESTGTHSKQWWDFHSVVVSNSRSNIFWRTKHSREILPSFLDYKWMTNRKKQKNNRNHRLTTRTMPVLFGIHWQSVKLQEGWTTLFGILMIVGPKLHELFAFYIFYFAGCCLVSGCAPNFKFCCFGYCHIRLRNKAGTFTVM